MDAFSGALNGPRFKVDMWWGVLFLLLVICNLLQQFGYWMILVGSNMRIPSLNA